MPDHPESPDCPDSTDTGGSAVRFAALVALVALVAAFGFGAPVALAEPVETGAWLMLGAGYDSNPLRITGDGPDGGFVEARYDAEIDHVFTPRLKWFLDADGSSRHNESSASGGDRESHDLRVGLGIAPLSVRNRQVLVQFGATYEVDRSTFLDRPTGEPFTVPAADATRVPIPDRYSADTVGAFADVYWQPWKRTRVSVETGIERASYRQDYPEGSPLRPLDHRLLSIQPSIAYRLAPDLVLGLSVYLADVDYDEERARDGAGGFIDGSRRQLRYADVRLFARWSPLQRLRVTASLHGGDRDDPREGYYDYSRLSSYLRVDYAVRRDLRVRVSGYWRDRDDSRIALSDLELDQRQSDRRSLRGAIYWKFHPAVGAFGEVVQQASESWQPDYTYDQDWILAGVTFSL